MMGFVSKIAQAGFSPGLALYNSIKGKKKDKPTSLASPGYNSADVGNGTGPQLMRRI